MKERSLLKDTVCPAETVIVGRANATNRPVDLWRDGTYPGPMAPFTAGLRFPPEVLEILAKEPWRTNCACDPRTGPSPENLIDCANAALEYWALHEKWELERAQYFSGHRWIADRWVPVPAAQAFQARAFRLRQFQARDPYSHAISSTPARGLSVTYWLFVQPV